jgi:hypothetical protein
MPCPSSIGTTADRPRVPEEIAAVVAVARIAVPATIADVVAVVGHPKDAVAVTIVDVVTNARPRKAVRPARKETSPRPAAKKPSAPPPVVRKSDPVRNAKSAQSGPNGVSGPSAVHVAVDAMPPRVTTHRRAASPPAMSKRLARKSRAVPVPSVPDPNAGVENVPIGEIAANALHAVTPRAARHHEVTSPAVKGRDDVRGERFAKNLPQMTSVLGLVIRRASVASQAPANHLRATKGAAKVGDRVVAVAVVKPLPSAVSALFPRMISRMTSSLGPPPRRRLKRKKNPLSHRGAAVGIVRDASRAVRSHAHSAISSSSRMMLPKCPLRAGIRTRMKRTTSSRLPATTNCRRGKRPFRTWSIRVRQAMAEVVPVPTEAIAPVAATGRAARVAVAHADAGNRSRRHRRP